MKRLTVNRIAGAGIRQNKRGYFSLALGIFLSIFLITVVCLCVSGLYAAGQERLNRTIGYENAFLLSPSYLTEETLLSSGQVERLGRISVLAALPEIDRYLGFYDTEAAALLNRTPINGRMPEKAGEIAVEQHVLSMLGVEKEIGDTLTLTLTPIDGTAEKREYTLVGILDNQSVTLDITSTLRRFSDISGTDKLPALIVSATDTPFRTGRTVTHYPMVVSSPMALYRLMTQYPDELFFVPSVESQHIVFPEEVLLNTRVLSADAANQMWLYMILGVTLLLAVCVGISGAMEGQLARRTEEIAMLRAVGATKRQIRRIFGREAYLLALILSPLSVAAACLTVWGLAALLPDMLVFAPSAKLLVPIALFSALTILLSSGLPLRRAAATMPMQAVRQSDVLRKAKRFRPRRAFRPARLIAWRQLCIRPTRLLGPTALVLLTVVIIGFVGIFLTLSDEDLTPQAAFTLTSRNAFYLGVGSFLDSVPDIQLSTQDMAQIAAIPGVKSVSAQRQMMVILPLAEDAPHDYFGLPYLTREAASSAGQSIEINFQSDSIREEYSGFKTALGIPGEAAEIALYVVDEASITQLQGNVRAGKIDLDAINAGREVLVHAPDIYMDVRASGAGEVMEYYYDEEAALSGITHWDAVYRNDYFTAGQRLPLIQMWCAEKDLVLRDRNQSTEYYADYFGQYAETANRAEVTVGAVLGGRTDGYGNRFIMTTEKGMLAMGLEPGRLFYVNVALTGDPDAATEKWLESRLETIAARGDAEVRNNLQQARETAAWRRQVTAGFMGLAVVLFAASVGMIAGNVGRRLRADRRAIGALRAVGADRKTILECYSGQAFFGVTTGTILGIGLMVLLNTFTQLFGMNPGEVLRMAALQLSFGVLTLASCLVILHLRVRAMTKESIIDSIREL